MAWHRRSSPLAQHRTRNVRVSFAAIPRIRNDQGHVLFEARSRPGAFTPPGGVFKCFEPAADILENLGFRGDRWTNREVDMRADLRGMLPARSVREFCRWFETGAYREDATECLQRELTEVGFPELVADVAALRFAHLNTVVEGPAVLMDKPYKLMRRFEFYELVCAGRKAARLRDGIIALAADPCVHTVLEASVTDIEHGRSGKALIAPHSDYLTGSGRTRSDIPSVR